MADLNSYSRKWFVKDFGDGEEAFYIEHITDNEYMKLDKASIEILTVNDKPIERKNHEKFNEMLINRALKDWKGINKGNKPAKCTKENKIMLLEHLPDRALFVIGQARNPVAFSEDYSTIKKKLDELLSSDGNGKQTNQELTAENV